MPTVIASVVTIVWAVSVMLEAVWRSYEPPATVHALMMAVAGWAFGQRYFARNGGTLPPAPPPSSPPDPPAPPAPPTGETPT